MHSGRMPPPAAGNPSAPAAEACRVCSHPATPIFRGRVLDHDVQYFDCPHCGYVQTERPHWLAQAYSRAINSVDTGILWRNRVNAGRVAMTLLVLGRLRGRVVDFAGGYGILVRLLRDVGIDAYWQDRYCENLVAPGFESDGSASDLLTAFEVFEHLVDPLAELREMLALAPAVLISTEIVPTPGPPDPHWWYLGPEHGQHIGFFRPSTLQHLARTLGCHVVSDGRSLHLFTRERPPLGWSTAVRCWRAGETIARALLHSKTVTDFEHLRSR